MTRFGSPPLARAGVCLEIDDSKRRIAIRGWYLESVSIPPIYLDADDVLSALGATREPRRPAVHHHPRRRAGEEIPS